MTNLFWPIYKNIEKEIRILSEQIHFDDNQLTVYSVKIAELLIRCVVEIESLAKELYFENGGSKPEDRDLFYDTDCLNFLEKKWKLSEKIIIVSATNFFFEKEGNRILRPLKKANKRGSSGPIWARAYQAVKHNRSEDLVKGNVGNLIKAASALFLLNLYYKNETFDLVNTNSDNFSRSFSDIFSIKVHTWHGTNVDQNHYVKNKDFNECIFLIKWTNNYLKDYLNWALEVNKETSNLIFTHPKVQRHIIDNFTRDGKIDQDKLKDYAEKRKYFDQIDIKTDYADIIRKGTANATAKTNFDFLKNPAKYEGILNKNQDLVYPEDEPSH